MTLRETRIRHLYPRVCIVKTCLKRPLQKRQNKDLDDRWQLNEGQKYCRMLQLENSAIRLTCIMRYWSWKPIFSIFDKTKILMTDGSLMKVKSIAECSNWRILQIEYFWPALCDIGHGNQFFVFLREAVLDSYYCIPKHFRLVLLKTRSITFFSIDGHHLRCPHTLYFPHTMDVLVSVCNWFFWRVSPGS